GRLPGSVFRMRSASRGRPGTPPQRRRHPLGGTAGTRRHHEGRREGRDERRRTWRRREAGEVAVAVPKRKMSRSNTRHRRSQWKAAVPTLVACERCHEPKQQHIACPSCGTYNKRQVLEV